MIAGIGVDLCEVRRIGDTLTRYGDRLTQRLLHPVEIEAFRQAPNPVNFLAKSWAAKEAFGKALGTGMRGFRWSDLGLDRDALGRPGWVFSDPLAAQLALRGVGAAHVSLSDDGGFVAAFVVLERAL